MVFDIETVGLFVSKEYISSKDIQSNAHQVVTVYIQNIHFPDLHETAYLEQISIRRGLFISNTIISYEFAIDIINYRLHNYFSF